MVAAFQQFAAKLSIPHIAFIPLSALHGDNVVEPSEQMPWYQGPTLLHHLETVNVGASQNRVDFRFPVQYVLRPHQDFRGYAGQVASGAIRPGEEVVVLPSGQASRVASVTTFEGEQPEARVGASVAVTLADEIDVSRGDMLGRPGNQPIVSRFLDADLCWMSEAPMRVGGSYIVQHTTQQIAAFVSKLVYAFDVNTLHRVKQPTLGLNEIGRVEITATQPLSFDPYRHNRQTGGFILIDADTNATVAAGMIRGEAASPQERRIEHADQTSSHVVWEALNIDRAEREAKSGHQATVIWLTGLSGSGKSTIARALERRLFEAQCQTMLLDGDNVRHGLSRDLGFSAQDREEHIRRVGEVARLFFEQGSIVVCAFISPAQADRDRVRSLLPEGRFIEVFVDCPLETCIQRDPKGLYQKALAGEIPQFTGISAPYEAPVSPEITVLTDEVDIAEAVDQIWVVLNVAGVLPAG
ncbi:MAG: hypothetical protein RhofKO_43770 [Rhodothermales bacterium]